MKINNKKGITDISGFKAVGVYSGVKRSKKNDLSLIYSEKPAVSAATFTKNKVKAAPVIVNMKNIKSQNTQAIIINSGNANACTGEKGIENAKKMIQQTSKLLNLSENEVLVGSTGIIGVPMPMDKISHGIEKACKTLTTGTTESAAEGIITTDTFTKSLSVEFEINNKPITISGIAKGSGMIHPNMGTMLSFLVTNISITKELLSKALKESVEDSYNMVSVDGDTSTNDMVIALANATANNNLINKENEDYKKFKQALNMLNKELAKMIAKDGEGATKLIEVTLKNAKTKGDAKLCAKSVITSSLVKSALFGSDANWGRILCALGYSNADFDPNKVEVSIKNEIGTVKLFENGSGLNFDEKYAKEILSQEYVNIDIHLNDGIYNATAWGCDLSYDYVKINGCYRT